MKGEAELNALLLLSKTYWRLDAIEINDFGERTADGTGEIIIKKVPNELHSTIYKKILRVIGDEQEKAADLFEEAAAAYAKAAKTDA